MSEILHHQKYRAPHRRCALPAPRRGEHAGEGSGGGEAPAGALRLRHHRLRPAAAPRLPARAEGEGPSPGKLPPPAPGGGAWRASWAWAQRWREEAPKAVACLERDLEELLNVLACPEAHRRKVRTTNAIERAFREARRRSLHTCGIS